MTTTQQPRFAKGDQVTVIGPSANHAVWTVTGVIEPTRSQPQWGYQIESPADASGYKRKRTKDENKLTLVKSAAEVQA